MAFGNGMARMLTKALVCAFDAFTADARWSRIARASEIVRSEVKKHTRRVIEIYGQARGRHDRQRAQENIERMMRESALIR
jgi:hypothetical protein